jgi:hypothetical protein
VSPILVRPVREQLEHDRIIRLLQVKLKRKHEVIANIGEDQSTSVKIGPLQIFPDLVLTTTDRARKLMGTVEVETSESVNHLEARSQWAHLGRARAPFHLYVPLGSVDIARRLAAENQVHISEIWSFHTIGDQTHFRLVHRTPDDARRSNGPQGIVMTRTETPLRPPTPVVAVPVKPAVAVPLKPAAAVPAKPVAASPGKKVAAAPAKKAVTPVVAPAAAPKKAAPPRTAKRPAAPARKTKVAAATRRAAPARKSAPARAPKSAQKRK